MESSQKETQEMEWNEAKQSQRKLHDSPIYSNISCRRSCVGQAKTRSALSRLLLDDLHICGKQYHHHDELNAGSKQYFLFTGAAPLRPQCHWRLSLRNAMTKPCSSQRCNQDTHFIVLAEAAPAAVPPATM
mmetsp:Transcript_2185/g.5567  ORF Transcript_2185/g.5567 Transcript_2185/m.5567 type:complete len:131 (+) Transcript_2185:114-506(+)